MPEDKAKYETLPVLKDFLGRVIVLWKKHHLHFKDYYIVGSYWSTIGFVEEVPLNHDDRKDGKLSGLGTLNIHRIITIGFDLTPTTQMTEKKYEALEKDIMELMKAFHPKGIHLHYKIINPFYFTE